MILANKISLFIAKAQTRLRELQAMQIEEFDYSGYQSRRSEDLAIKLSETYDFIDLLKTSDRGGLSNKEIASLIDFFIIWLDLNTVVAANYANYQMPILGNVVLPGGTYPTAADLASEILARIAADSALSARITELETNGIDPGAIFPEGFFDNYDSTYTVVFDDDPRLHTHENILLLNEINETDITNLKALTAHFSSLGDPGGMHVTQEDRDRWDSNTGGSGTGTIIKVQSFVADGLTQSFEITSGVPTQINFVSINGFIQTPGTYTLIGQDISFDDNLAEDDVLLVSFYEDLLVVDSGGAGLYDLTSPTTITVGGLPAGSNLTGRTWQSIIEEIAVEYMLPAFSSFNITDLPSVVEVGVAVSGTRNFTWSTSSSGNVAPNTVTIRDVTDSTSIASGLANDGSQSVDIGVIENTAPMSHVWRAQALNTNGGSFQSGTRSITSLYPYFYGKVSSGGAAPGSGRPTANQALIASGTKVVASSANTIIINFGSTADDYIWFAIPAAMASKVSWYVSAINNGAIGGAVSPGGNLFPAHSLVEIDSPGSLWENINYKIFISNYQTAAVANMELRNT